MNFLYILIFYECLWINEDENFAIAILSSRIKFLFFEKYI